MAVLVCTVIAALALFDNNDFITAGQHSITLVRQSGTHGDHHAACLLQPLRKLPDRINGAAPLVGQFHVAGVDIAGGAVTGAISACDNADLLPIRHPEFLFAVRGDKADAFFGFLHVPLQQVPAVSIDICVIQQLGWRTTE